MNELRDVILAPIVTEKSANISADGRKVELKVARDANKIQIRQAVEKIFNVKVTNVNTINVRPKKKRVGKYSGFRKTYKKAIVKLADGSSIEM